ncbi:MAG: orotidine-5'-phosphate decarboxylase [Phycisphaeraceae bacterium]|nr:orotidine-5'-phosphate decarboxylase [Phycisphaeraceae bacterium]
MTSHSSPAHFADRLLAACQHKGAPVCVGLDPVYERLPASLRSAGPANPATDAQAACAIIAQFCFGVLKAVAPYVPAVKPQSACFERYLWPGLEVYHRVVRQARELGLLVIGDAKRGDIGISAEHYAAGCLADTRFADLGQTPGPDALTVNSYLGPDSLQPFLNVAAAQGKGLFALVRTSNPGSDALQSLSLSDGRSVADAVAQWLAQVGSAPNCVGAKGYSLLGAVVGATKPQDAARLRQLMPQQIFLVPGFGAQGGKADDVKACFKKDGQGAIITASRSVLFAYEKPATSDWQGAIAKAAADLKGQIAAILN